MKIVIDIETDDNNQQLVRAILADVIGQIAKNLPEEVEKETLLADGNCGFSWECLIKPEE